MPKARENAPPKARENAGNQDVIGFYFVYDWLRERERERERREFSGPITERSKGKPTEYNPGLLLEHNWKLLWSKNTPSSFMLWKQE